MIIWPEIKRRRMRKTKTGFDRQKMGMGQAVEKGQVQGMDKTPENDMDNVEEQETFYYPNS